MASKRALSLVLLVGATALVSPLVLADEFTQDDLRRWEQSYMSVVT